MPQQDGPDDYVIATGEQYSVRDFCERAFAEVGLIVVSGGDGADEVDTVASIDKGLLDTARSGNAPQGVRTKTSSRKAPLSYAFSVLIPHD